MNAYWAVRPPASTTRGGACGLSAERSAPSEQVHARGPTSHQLPVHPEPRLVPKNGSVASFTLTPRFGLAASGAAKSTSSPGSSRSAALAATDRAQVGGATSPSPTHGGSGAAARAAAAGPRSTPNASAAPELGASSAPSASTAPEPRRITAPAGEGGA